MRSDRIVGTLASGIVVYLFMACTASSGDGATKGVVAVNPPPANPSGSGTATAPSPTTSPTNPIPNAMADTWWVPGSRLKIRSFKSSDGAVQFLDWYDSTLAESCTFQVYADQSYRCIPRAEVAAEGIFYASHDCTGQTLVHLPNAPHLLYATVLASTSPQYPASPGIILYHLTSLTLVDTSVGDFSHYVTPPNGTCAQGGAGDLLYAGTEVMNLMDATIETSP